MKQLNLFTNWIDYQLKQPKDGQEILQYYEAEDPENAIFPENHQQHGDRTLVGPIISTYRRKYIEDGTFRKPTFWQPIEPLPAAA